MGTGKYQLASRGTSPHYDAVLLQPAPEASWCVSQMRSCECSPCPCHPNRKQVLTADTPRGPSLSFSPDIDDNLRRSPGNCLAFDETLTPGMVSQQQWSPRGGRWFAAPCRWRYRNGVTLHSKDEPSSGRHSICCFAAMAKGRYETIANLKGGQAPSFSLSSKVSVPWGC